NKGPTISVGKVLGAGEILGGYNPLAWKSGQQDVGVDTKESFIFALDGNSEKNIVSFVDDKKSSTAIVDYHKYYPVFGAGGGNDLSFGNEATKSYARKNSYQVSIRNLSDFFEWSDWEVF